MIPPSRFDALRTSSVRHRGLCARWGTHGRPAGAVRLNLQEVVPGKSNTQTVTTCSARFCEPCAIEVYEVLAERLLVEAKRR